jgi:hypothetical protein
MQQGGTDRIRIHPPFDHRACDGQGMRDVGFAGHAPLIGMRTGCVGIRSLDSCYISGGEIFETVEENPVSGFLIDRRQR